ncbi:MAG: FkbM family methyltransferase [Pseudomonadota bacterium]
MHPLATLDPIPGLDHTLEFYTHDPEQDLVSRKLHQERCWEPFESQLWLASLGEGDVVIDAGANLGYYSVLSAHSAVPALRVFALEPDPANYQLLCANIERNKAQASVVAMQVALGEFSGEAELHLSSSNKGDHQLFSASEERDSVLVSVLRGEDALSEMADRIDLVKIDTQGTELAVIEGLWPMLLKSRSRVRLLIELTPFSLRAAGASGAQLIERLSTLNLPFAIIDHVEHRIVPTSAEALVEWCQNVDSDPKDEGFMNIFVGEPPRLG